MMRRRLVATLFIAALATAISAGFGRSAHADESIDFLFPTNLQIGGVRSLPGLGPASPIGRPNNIQPHARAALTPSISAAAHGGTVKAANEPDAGAKFVLKLPGADELAEPVAL